MDRRAEPEVALDESPTTGVRVFAFVYFVAAFGLGVALESISPTDWPSPGLRLAVAAITGAGWLGLDIAAIALFGAAGTSIWPMVPSSTLVTSGPYRFTRNPQYVGLGCLYVALAFAFGVMWALALLPAVLVVIDRRIVAREEAYLERRFGQPYREYKSRVRRWL